MVGHTQDSLVLKVTYEGECQQGDAYSQGQFSSLKQEGDRQQNVNMVEALLKEENFKTEL